MVALSMHCGQLSNKLWASGRRSIPSRNSRIASLSSRRWQFFYWIPLLSLLSSHNLVTWSLQPAFVDSGRNKFRIFEMVRPTRAQRLLATKQDDSNHAENDDESDVGKQRKSTRKRSHNQVGDLEVKSEVESEFGTKSRKAAKSSSPKGKTAKNKTKTSPKKAPSSPKWKTATNKTKTSPKKAPRAKKTGVSKRQAKGKVKASQEAPSDKDDDSSASANSKTVKKRSPSKKKASDHQRVTERDVLPKLWDPDFSKKNGSYTFKIASWNVAGLRALLRKSPEALSNLCKNHDLDMLCLQETKIQESHVDDPKIAGNLLVDDGYDSYYSCSTAKKGYSGTAVYVKKHGKKGKEKKTIEQFFAPKSTVKGQKDAIKEPVEVVVGAETLTPVDVTYKLGKEIDAEGRTIIVDLPFATIVNVYVPNSGQTLQRLTYRTEEWDKFFLEFMQKKHLDRGLPIMWLGDLNVAHTAMEVWNDGAKHLVKQAGVTPQERASFQAQLDSGFIDAFRKLHPNAKGQYSYWSQRAGNREPNKGLRLDYFICSPEMFQEDSNVIVRDSYMIYDEWGSDHCPVVIELEIKKK